jgi:beta-barrel assembly-enhancing protease
MISANRRDFMHWAGRWALLGLGGAPLLSGLLSGCKAIEAVSKAGADLGVATGVIDEKQAQSIKKSGTAVSRSFEDFTPEQEYYIGRTVGAVILQKYKPYENQAANDYINLLGQTLARASDMPETYGGYHFLIQDSDEINALAAPGGLIFITRGMLRCCHHEDAMAAVLAHEIGHVQNKHGLQAIKTSRVTSALTTLGVESAKAFGGQELANLTETFEASIGDITKTLVNSGYSRAFESEADMAAVTILKRVGYDGNGLVDMLRVMQKRLKPGGLDFAKTHPAPEVRIADIGRMIGPYAPVQLSEARQPRFDRALQGV